MTPIANMEIIVQKQTQKRAARKHKIYFHRQKNLNHLEIIICKIYQTV